MLPQQPPLGLRSLISNLGNLNTNIIQSTSGRTIFPSDAEIAASLTLHHRVILNVGGQRHEVLWDSLSRHPHTRLGQLGKCSSHDRIMEVCQDYTLGDEKERKNEYFWDRASGSFPPILNLYRKGKLHLPEDVCVLEFAEELEYWGIDAEMALDPCCQMKYQVRRDQLSEDLKKDELVLAVCQEEEEEEEFGSGVFDRSRKFVWELFEK